MNRNNFDERQVSEKQKSIMTTDQGREFKKRIVSENQVSFNSEFLILKDQLGQGGFGCVFDAIYKNFPVVLKTSLSEKDDKYIIREYNFLKLLEEGNFLGIPRVEHIFVYNGKQSFLMQKLGIDLRKYQKALFDRKVSQRYTLKIAIQVLRILKSVHSYGIVHSDIKLDNIMTDGSSSKTIYLVDFGAATTFNRENKNLSRRHDLISLAYVLVELGSGKLPWDEILCAKNMSRNEKCEKLLEWERKRAEDICDGMCKEFAVFLDKVRNLSLEQEPEYDKYCEMFGKLLK